MSVRAYIVYKTKMVEGSVKVDGQEIDCWVNKQYESFKDIFNCWRNPELVSLIAENGYDSRNCDGVGEMGIDSDEFFNAIEELSDKELKIIQENNHGYGARELSELIKYLNNHDYIVLNCY